MPDKNPIRAEYHFPDGRVVLDDMHFSPPNWPLDLAELPTPAASRPVFSTRSIRSDGVHVMYEE
jgi:hypothetical protein